GGRAQGRATTRGPAGGGGAGARGRRRGGCGGRPQRGPPARERAAQKRHGPKASPGSQPPQSATESSCCFAHGFEALDVCLARLRMEAHRLSTHSIRNVALPMLPTNGRNLRRAGPSLTRDPGVSLPAASIVRGRAAHAAHAAPCRGAGGLRRLLRSARWPVEHDGINLADHPLLDVLILVDRDMSNARNRVDVDVLERALEAFGWLDGGAGTVGDVEVDVATDTTRQAGVKQR